MNELFELTDHEIELYIEDAMAKDDEIMNTRGGDPDADIEWFENRKQPIYSCFNREYNKYVKKGKYFFGCPFSIYESNYEARKKEFLEAFEDFEIYDFLNQEIKEGVLNFDRQYMEPSKMLQIEASLRKRMAFLKNEAKKHDLEIIVINSKLAELKHLKKEIKEENNYENEVAGFSIPMRVLILHELGIIDQLKKIQPFSTTPYALSRALCPIINIGATDLNRYIYPIHTPESNQDRNPLKNIKNHNKVKEYLNQLGFRRSVS
jgi:hypothetical protein